MESGSSASRRTLDNKMRTRPHSHCMNWRYQGDFTKRKRVVSSMSLFETESFESEKKTILYMCIKCIRSEVTRKLSHYTTFEA